MKRISLDDYSLSQLQGMLADLESGDPSKRASVLITLDITEEDIREYLDDMEKQKLYGRFWNRLLNKD